MPPVLTMSSRNYDYDYDTVQPCFFLDGEEEDFYLPRRCQLLPGPSEDIWKKFELLPTPPLSPSRRASPPGVRLSTAEPQQALCDLLDEERNPTAALLQSFIIQDCMWSSSFAAATELEKVVSERLASLRARRDSNADTGGAAPEQLGGARASTGDLQDCVDPSVVFPYRSLSDRSSDGAEMEAESELCLDSPPLSSSDSESEEEGEEEDEEDEEVDVVTVDRRKVSRQSDARGRPDTSPLVLKRSHINVHQHNYAAQQPAGKRMKSASGCAAAPRPSGGGRRCWSPESDGEDDRRRSHNVLERQRRNELKMSFVALREEVPAVANNDRAAKVTILKTATAFVVELREKERRLLAMKEELRRRSRELTHRLEQLRTLH